MNRRADQDPLFDTTTHDEIAELRASTHAAWVEVSHYRDLWMRLLHARNRWERSVRGAAERRARDQAYGLIVAALPKTLATLRQMAQTVLDLPERPAPYQMEKIRQLAESVDVWDPLEGAESRAIAAIQAAADVEIDMWRERACLYFDQAQRSRTELVAAEDTYNDLVSAGWQPPAWRVAQHRAAMAAEQAQPAAAGSEVTG